MKILRTKQPIQALNRKCQVTKNIIRRSINLLNSKQANKYHTTVINFIISIMIIQFY